MLRADGAGGAHFEKLRYFALRDRVPPCVVLSRCRKTQFSHPLVDVQIVINVGQYETPLLSRNAFPFDRGLVERLRFD
jgi:hypothetical protein